MFRPFQQHSAVEVALFVSQFSSTMLRAVVRGEFVRLPTSGRLCRGDTHVKHVVSMPSLFAAGAAASNACLRQQVRGVSGEASLVLSLSLSLTRLISRHPSIQPTLFLLRPRLDRRFFRYHQREALCTAAQLLRLLHLPTLHVHLCFIHFPLDLPDRTKIVS